MTRQTTIFVIGALRVKIKSRGLNTHCTKNLSRALCTLIKNLMMMFVCANDRMPDFEKIAVCVGSHLSWNCIHLPFQQSKIFPYLKCPQQVWHMLRTYADFRVNHCGSWRMSADVRYKSADVRASVKACGLLRTFFRITWGYLFADVRSSMQVSLRTSAKACVKF